MTTTGPITRSYSSDTYYRYQQWYRQGLPRRAPLYYNMELRTSKPWSNSIGQSGPGSAGAAEFTTIDSSPAYIHAYNRAYGKYRTAILGEASSLGVNLAERKQAIDMMTSRVTQIYKFARAVKSFRFVEAATILGLDVVSRKGNTIKVKRPEYVKRSKWNQAKRRFDHSTKPISEIPFQIGGIRRPVKRRPDGSEIAELRFKKRISAFGGNFLEYHFGWDPLIKDIGAVMEVLDDPIAAALGKRRKGGATHKVVVPNPVTPNFAIGTGSSWRSGVCIAADVQVTNLNLHLADRMGLLNPMVIAWELVPFSFIADWFGNFGDYLESFTSFSGLTLSNVSTTHFLEASWTKFYRYYGPYYPMETKKSVCVKRTLGTSGPILSLRPLKWPSLTRGLTAASLLAQLLKSA